MLTDFLLFEKRYYCQHDQYTGKERWKSRAWQYLYFLLVWQRVSPKEEFIGLWVLDLPNVFVFSDLKGFFVLPSFITHNVLGV